MPIGPRLFDVWPKGVSIQPLERSVFFVIFADNEEFAGSLVNKLLKAESEFRDRTPPDWLGGGGAKIRDIASWDCPVLDLLNFRAMEFFKRVTGKKTAVIDDLWANVSRAGEFIGPHAHRRTEASLVYHLLPPPRAVCEKFEGSLGICDPRLERCCPAQPGHATSQIYPPMNPGTFVMFPSFISHYVTPFQGDDPRISIAWNIADSAIPGRPTDQPLL